MTDLIQNHGVEEFLSGFRGNFDKLCAETVFDLKSRFPAVKNIMVLSYLAPRFVLPKFFICLKKASPRNLPFPIRTVR